MNKESANTVFLNGKNKLIKMFQLLSEKEKNSLLNKVGQKNPKLAEELRFKSITFEKIFTISEKELRILFQQLNPSILGISLKGSPVSHQRKVLSLAPRDYAEKAFQMMTSKINDEDNSIIKSRQKVIDSLGSLNKMGLIEF